MVSTRKDWSAKLKDAQWAYRTAYKTPIGFSLFQLVYGKSCHLPVEMEHKAYWALKFLNFDEKVKKKKKVIKHMSHIKKLFNQITIKGKKKYILF